jgi:hypothetical protein
MLTRIMPPIHSRIQRRMINYGPKTQAFVNLGPWKRIDLMLNKPPLALELLFVTDSTAILHVLATMLPTLHLFLMEAPLTQIKEVLFQPRHLVEEAPSRLI